MFTLENSIGKYLTILFNHSNENQSKTQSKHDVMWLLSMEMIYKLKIKWNTLAC